MDANEQGNTCRNCGAPVAAGVSLCPNCGAAREDQTPEHGAPQPRTATSETGCMEALLGLVAGAIIIGLGIWVIYVGLIAMIVTVILTARKYRTFALTVLGVVLFGALVAAALSVCFRGMGPG